MTSAVSLAYSSAMVLLFYRKMKGMLLTQGAR
jgi:hypothetical protein